MVLNESFNTLSQRLAPTLVRLKSGLWDASSNGICNHEHGLLQKRHKRHLDANAHSVLEASNLTIGHPPVPYVSRRLIMAMFSGYRVTHEHPKPLGAPGVREETIFGLQGERQCRDDRQVIGASLRRCRTP
ncbi:hypothetical protein THIX_10014 [Thiomonas sp. X19]|nr:hypothetical protein THIX_10014 [Thiomonas sp. X19]